MSYCRWSSDDFACDLYCYEDVRGGYTTHIASNRVVGEVPPVPDILEVVPEEWVAACNAQDAFLGTVQREPIGLPFDGQTFNDPGLESFLARLIELRAAGYRFPECVLNDVKAEIEQEKRQ